VETFPPEARLTSVAVGYNIALALLGGTTPALATYLVDEVGALAPSYILSGVSVLSLIGLYLGRNKQYIHARHEPEPSLITNYGRLV
jgi:MHS family proline/betaine transporter-like MFS transporter